MGPFTAALFQRAFGLGALVLMAAAAVAMAAIPASEAGDHAAQHFKWMRNSPAAPRLACGLPSSQE